LRRAVENFAYDAIVLDILLPGCSGYEVLRGYAHRVWSSVLMLCAKEGAQEEVVTGGAGMLDDWLRGVSGGLVAVRSEDTPPDQARHDPLRFRGLTALGPIQYLAYEVHRGVRV
jgi:hypothetical protein